VKSLCTIGSGQVPSIRVSSMSAALRLVSTKVFGKHA